MAQAYQLLNDSESPKEQVLERIKAKAEKGDADAQHKMGSYFHKREKYAQALPYFKLAAEQNHVNALYMVGLYWQEGYVENISYPEAIAFYERAAAKGKRSAIYAVGYCHQKLANFKQARIWYEKALVANHLNAKKALDKMNAKLNITSPLSKETKMQLLKDSLGEKSNASGALPPPGSPLHLRAQSEMLAATGTAPGKNIPHHAAAASMQLPPHKSGAEAAASPRSAGSPKSPSSPEPRPSPPAQLLPAVDEKTISPTCQAIFLNMQQYRKLAEEIHNLKNPRQPKDDLQTKQDQEILRKKEQEIKEIGMTTLKLIKDKLKLSKANTWRENMMAGMKDAFLPSPLLIHALSQPHFLKAMLERNTPHSEENKSAKLDVNVRDALGNTALHLAIIHNHKESIDLLLKHPDIKLNAPNNIGQTVIYLAISKGDLELVKKLLNDPRQVGKEPTERMRLKKDWLNKVNVRGNNPAALSALNRVKELRKIAEEKWDKTKSDPDSKEYDFHYQQYLAWAEIQDHLEPDATVTHAKETKFKMACEKIMHHLKEHQKLIAEQKALEREMADHEREHKSSAVALSRYSNPIQGIQEKIALRIKAIMTLIADKDLVPNPERLSALQELKMLVLVASKDNKALADALAKVGFSKYFENPVNSDIKTLHEKHLVHRWQYYAKTMRAEKEVKKHLVGNEQAKQEYEKKNADLESKFAAEKAKLKRLNDEAAKKEDYSEQTDRDIVTLRHELRRLQTERADNERQYQFSAQKKNYDNAVKAQEDIKKERLPVLAKEKIALHNLYKKNHHQLSHEEKEIKVLEEKWASNSQKIQKLSASEAEEDAAQVAKLGTENFALFKEAKEKRSKLPENLQQLQRFKSWGSPICSLLIPIVRRQSAPTGAKDEHKDSKRIHSDAGNSSSSSSSSSTASSAAPAPTFQIVR